MTVNHAFAIDHPDDKSGYVVFAVRVEARHLGGLAAEQHTAIFTTPVGDAFHDARDCFGREPSGCDVIQKEERPRALHENVVRAVVYQIASDGVMSAGRK